MTVIQPNSITGINSITVQSGQALNIHDANGNIIRNITSSSGVSTYQALHVGSGTTTSTQGISVGTGCSIVSDAVNTLDVYTAASNRIRIDSSGKVLHGHTTSRAIGNVTADVQIEGTDAAASLSICRNSNNAPGPYISLAKSRAGSVGGNTVIQVDDSLGAILFSGADGTDLTNNAASIIAQVDATPGNNDTPGRLTFNTTADGGTSPTERIRVYSDGCVGVGTMGADSRKDGHLQVETETTGRYAASFANHHASGSKGIRVQACDSDESNWILLCENRDGTNRFGVKGTGDVEVSNGDLIFGTSAKGVVLGATSNTDANTLDDYEEGSFTCTIAPQTSGSVSLNSSYNQGSYTKIGNLVHIQAYLSISGVSSPVGVLQINGLPFACANLADASGHGRAIGQAYFNGGSPPDGSGYYAVQHYLNEDNSWVRVYHMNASGKRVDDAVGLLANGSDIFLHLSYFAA